ncbi:hypothetical protein PEC18_39600 [Paucibacter sp. O1-1]|nr:hypothetical protein [Paucibacter sp. O1-1]MDA3831716.1 hypothetical protein [Paucibacter sp. O1-1]
MKIGDEVEVGRRETERGRTRSACSSRKRKQVITAWDNIQKSFDEDAVIDANVKRRTKGGLIVDIFGIGGFLARFTD